MTTASFPRRRAFWMLTFGLVGFAAGVLVAGCPSTGINCNPGTNRCGLGCADFRSDSQNCGACGVACQALQICQDSACQCRPGATLCGTSCVVLSSDLTNCGRCGRSCLLPDGGAPAGGAVCEPADGGSADLPGECHAVCTRPELTNCAGGCVNLLTDAVNCGACGLTCLAGQSCRAGSCRFDVVAACVDTGLVVGIQAVSDVTGARTAFGNRPQALGAVRGVLLEGDGFDLKLEQMRLKDFAVLGPPVLADGGTSTFNDVGNSPNHILVEDPYVYVVNGTPQADGGSLQVLLRRTELNPDAGSPAPGIDLQLIGTLNFDGGNPPQALAKLGNNLYIPLYLGDVAEVDVSVPATPSRRRNFDLRTLNLMPFDAGVQTFPRPLGVAAFGGTVYVAVQNLDAVGNPGGRALLARLNLGTGLAEPVLLPTGCLGAYWLAPAGAGDTLYASCAGRLQRDGGTVISIDSSGVVAMSSDGGVALWNAGCDGGSACFPAAPGRFAVVGTRLYVGDELGRLFVVENADGGFIERRGYNSATGGLPLAVCPSSTTGSGAVNDVIAVP